MTKTKKEKILLSLLVILVITSIVFGVLYVGYIQKNQFEPSDQKIYTFFQYANKPLKNIKEGDNQGTNDPQIFCEKGTIQILNATSQVSDLYKQCQDNKYRVGEVLPNSSCGPIWTGGETNLQWLPTNTDNSNCRFTNTTPETPCTYGGNQNCKFRDVTAWVASKCDGKSLCLTSELLDGSVAPPPCNNKSWKNSTSSWLESIQGVNVISSFPIAETDSSDPNKVTRGYIMSGAYVCKTD